MPDVPQNIPVSMPTEGFPSVYANLASITANYNELRIYLADVQARAVATGVLPSAQGQQVSEASIAPRICLVLTPEFAKSLLDALSSTVAMYEKQFGPLRPMPQPPTQVAAPKPSGTGKT